MLNENVLILNDNLFIRLSFAQHAHGGEQSCINDIHCVVFMYLRDAGKAEVAAAIARGESFPESRGAARLFCLVFLRCCSEGRGGTLLAQNRCNDCIFKTCDLK